MPCSPRSVRSVGVSLLAAVTLLALTACSGSDDAETSTTEASAADQTDTTPAASTPADEVAQVPGSAPDSADDVPADDGADPSSAACGGVSAADVAAASGVAGIAAADDISVDVDVTCLFSVPATTDAISIGSQAVSDYLGGELVDAAPADALATLASTQEIFLSEVTSSEQVEVGGVMALVIVGTSSTAGAVGYAAAVTDGTLVEINASGSGIAADPAALAGTVTGVLELALATPR